MFFHVHQFARLEWLDWLGRRMLLLLRPTHSLDFSSAGNRHVGFHVVEFFVVDVILAKRLVLELAFFFQVEALKVV